jgi:hypothetical protein
MNTPEELANGLAFLQIDVSDPDFHALALEQSRRTVAGYRLLLDAAVAAGELMPCDTARLARTVAALSGGSLIAWAIHRKGTAAGWVRHDIETLLDPYRPAPDSAARRAGVRRGAAKSRTATPKRGSRA